MGQRYCDGNGVDDGPVTMARPVNPSAPGMPEKEGQTGEIHSWMIPPPPLFGTTTFQHRFQYRKRYTVYDSVNGAVNDTRKWRQNEQQEKQEEATISAKV